MNIRVEQIILNNRLECSQLSVKPEKERYLGSNLLCIAEMQF